MAAASRKLGEKLTLSVPQEALTLVCEHAQDEGTPHPADWHVYRYRAGASLDDAFVMEGQAMGQFNIIALTNTTLEGRLVHPVIQEVPELILKMWAPPFSPTFQVCKQGGVHILG